MAKAKCQWCKKEVDTKIAHKEVINGKNKYWCNDNCYRAYEKEREKQTKLKAEYDEIYELTKQIFGYEFAGHSLLQKELKTWEKLSTRQKIISCLKENKDWLSGVMSKEFQNDYGRMRYFSTVISGKLHDYKPKSVEVDKPKIVIDETIYESPSYSLNKRRSLADLEDDI